MDRLDDRLVDACRRNGDVSDCGSGTKAVRKGLLRDDDAVESVSVRVDYDRLGFRTVIVRLTVGADAIDDCIERLRARSAFPVVYEVAGTPNLFAVAKFQSEPELADGLKRLLTDPAVRSVSVDSVDETVKEGAPVDPSSADGAC